ELRLDDRADVVAADGAVDVGRFGRIELEQQRRLEAQNQSFLRRHFGHFLDFLRLHRHLDHARERDDEPDAGRQRLRRHLTEKIFHADMAGGHGSKRSHEQKNHEADDQQSEADGGFGPTRVQRDWIEIPVHVMLLDSSRLPPAWGFRLWASGWVQASGFSPGRKSKAQSLFRISSLLSVLARACAISMSRLTNAQATLIASRSTL